MYVRDSNTTVHILVRFSFFLSFVFFLFIGYISLFLYSMLCLSIVRSTSCGIFMWYFYAWNNIGIFVIAFGFIVFKHHWNNVLGSHHSMVRPDLSSILQNIFWYLIPEFYLLCLHSSEKSFTFNPHCGSTYRSVHINIALSSAEFYLIDSNTL